MKFLDMVKQLQLKNHGYIVIIKNGIFFIGVGKDAILLNKILGLKLICLKTGLCKAGFLVKSIEKYIGLLSFSNHAFVVYQYKRKSGMEDVEEIFRYSGKKIYETRCSLDCENCKNKKETDEEIIERILKLPRTEKFNIGTEYKSSMYKMLNYILYLNKIVIQDRIYYCNLIDSELNCQRIYLRIMEKNKWISKEKCLVAMEKIYEIGKVLGGLIKHYAKNDKK